MIDLETIEARCETARCEVNRLCQKGRWTMSVPVREDDSDEILTNSFRDIPVLVAGVERLREELERLRELIPDVGMLHRLAYAADLWWEGQGEEAQQDITAGYALAEKIRESGAME